MNRLPDEVTHVAFSLRNDTYLIVTTTEISDEKTLTQDELIHCCRNNRLDYEYVTTRFV